MVAVTGIDSEPGLTAPEAEAPVCDYFAATFERLFRALVHADARVREVECAATGAPACVFEVGWRRRERAALGNYSTSRR
jgi:divinyl protochlorophyllide a 8-vinyl-reductase